MSEECSHVHSLVVLVMSVLGRNRKSQGISFNDVASLPLHIANEMKEAPLEFLLNLERGTSSAYGAVRRTQKARNQKRQYYTI